MMRFTRTARTWEFLDTQDIPVIGEIEQPWIEFHPRRHVKGLPVPIVAASVLVAFAGIGGSMALMQMGSSAGHAGHVAALPLPKPAPAPLKTAPQPGRASSWARYATFGVCLVPYRLIRRSQRNAEQRSRQHAELLLQLKQ
jgi:hypothetical protein